MEKTSRRNVLKVAGAAGVAAGLGVLVRPTGSPVVRALAAEEHDHGGGKPMSGPLSNATVTFGGWRTDPAFDRFAPDPNDRTRNHHQLTPNLVKIEEGGTVNFIIGGFHLVLVYDHETQPKDINRTLLSPPITGFPPLIDDPRKRIYRGLDPRTMPLAQDRVETVQFAKRGLYLVMCGVLPHFFNATTMQFEMFGYVRVVKADDH